MVREFENFGMISNFVRRHLDLSVYLLCLILTALIFEFELIGAKSFSEDDEFAEFADPDDSKPLQIFRL